MGVARRGSATWGDPALPATSAESKARDAGGDAPKLPPRAIPAAPTAAWGGAGLPEERKVPLAAAPLACLRVPGRQLTRARVRGISKLCGQMAREIWARSGPVSRNVRGWLWTVLHTSACGGSSAGACPDAAQPELNDGAHTVPACERLFEQRCMPPWLQRALELASREEFPNLTAKDNFPEQRQRSRPPSEGRQAAWDDDERSYAGARRVLGECQCYVNLLHALEIRLRTLQAFTGCQLQHSTYTRCAVVWCL
jgi:hypothetical protein